jgi:hypothetical protein
MRCQFNSQTPREQSEQAPTERSGPSHRTVDFNALERSSEVRFLTTTTNYSSRLPFHDSDHFTIIIDDNERAEKRFPLKVQRVVKITRRVNAKRCPLPLTTRHEHQPMPRALHRERSPKRRADNLASFVHPTP